jgi:hypothetical protein
MPKSRHHDRERSTGTTEEAEDQQAPDTEEVKARVDKITKDNAELLDAIDDAILRSLFEEEEIRRGVDDAEIAKRAKDAVDGFQQKGGE